MGITALLVCCPQRQVPGGRVTWPGCWLRNDQGHQHGWGFCSPSRAVGSAVLDPVCVAECHTDCGVRSLCKAEAGTRASPLSPWNQKCVPRRPNIQMQPACSPGIWFPGEERLRLCEGEREQHGLRVGEVCSSGGRRQAPGWGPRAGKPLEGDARCECWKFKPHLNSPCRGLQKWSITVPVPDSL